MSKIAVLHPATAYSTTPFNNFDPPRDPSRYLPGPSYTHVQVAKATAVRQVMETARGGFEVLINLCDGAWDEDRPGIEVVQALERLGVAFTGAGSAFYEPSRQAMKMAAYAAGVSVPPYVLAQSAADAERVLDCLRPPLIVKHPNSYSSLGLSRDSRVSTAAALRREMARMVEHYGAALVEEFIEGREFTVLVAEAREAHEEAWAFQPVEYLFPAGESFKHFDLKWKEFARMSTRPVTDVVLASRLCEASTGTFVGLAGSGYGRCDLRMDAAGEIYLLEINPNCSVFYPEGQFGSADVILAHDPAGHRGFLEHLIGCAQRRQARARKAWEIRFQRQHGFGLFAVRPLQCGEVVEPYEAQPQVLASRQYLQRHWHGLRRQWLAQYAWPLTGQVYALWSANPDDWRPLNHSCDPNTWLDGLNLVARRAIMPGEALTVDYATFCGPDMAAFPCHCGTALCRQVIRGTDHLLPELRARYGEHVSDYVRAAWRRQALGA